MAKNNLTIFQKLSQILGPDGIKNKKQEPQRYNIGKNELLKTDNKAEFETKKLEAQQFKYLAKTWIKNESNLTQQSISYETTRLASYSDFEAMEYFPEIAAAVDIFAEEATTLNSHGRMMNIYSDSKRVKTILEDLFFNRLDLHTSLPMWTRNTVKYGDNFVSLRIADKNGVVGVKQMPNYEMERRENDLVSLINQQNNDEDSSNRVKFFWRGQNAEFNSWQMAHFRLLGDDRKLPYGHSILEKARRIWKLLIMGEDAMLTNRLQRAGDRRVFKVFVGNLNDEDVDAYVNDIANRFKRTPVIDPQTGQIDLRYNQNSSDQDFFLPVRDANAPSPIETLQGSTTTDSIVDLEFLQNKLFAALRVPKSFLGFDQATGDGKNLALQDIRFSRTINRIQQSMLQELNKIAIIHLYLLGFEDDLDNFSLTLNNPSTQAEMLRVEHTQAKITLYKDAVSDAGNGFGAMCATRGHREILGWSDDEIKQDLLEQRMEKAAAAELANSSSVIKHTGLFDVVDRIHGDMDLALEGGGAAGGEGDDKGGAGGGGGGLGGSFGGGGTGGEDLDFGEESNGEEGGETPEGGEAQEGKTATEPSTDNEPTTTQAEAFKNVDKLLTERKEKLTEELDNRIAKYNNIFMNKLVESIKPSDKDKIEKIKIYDKNVKINENIGDMIDDIDKMLNS